MSLDPSSFHIITTLLRTSTSSLPSDPFSFTAPSNPPNSISYYLLPYHVSRLLASARAFSWPEAVTLLSDPNAQSVLTKAIESHISSTYPHSESHTTSYRIRILISQSGNLTVESLPITSTRDPSTHNGLFYPSILSPTPTTSPAPASTIHLFPLPTPPSLFTLHKTTHRPHYTTARTHFSLTPTTPPTSSEVLLHNPLNETTEATLSTIYIYSPTQDLWITPAANCGGNMGTTRQWALDHGLCVEGVVKTTDLRGGEEVWISNGVRGFIRGIIKLDGS